LWEKVPEGRMRGPSVSTMFSQMTLSRRAYGVSTVSHGAPAARACMRL